MSAWNVFGSRPGLMDGDGHGRRGTDGWFSCSISWQLLPQHLSFCVLNPPLSAGSGTFQTSSATVVLITICFKKGEKPGWRWGNRKD